MAGVDAGGGDIIFGWFKEQESAIIYQNEIEVATATMTVTSTSADTELTLYLSNDDGATWESVENEVKHTFAASAVTDKVKWKVVANTGVIVTQIDVDINSE